MPTKQQIEPIRPYYCGTCGYSIETAHWPSWQKAMPGVNHAGRCCPKCGDVAPPKSWRAGELHKHTSTIAVTNSRCFRNLAADSEGRNRGPAPRLLRMLDPHGIHVMSMQMPHNECEWRALWLVKINDQEHPVEIWMDNSFEAHEQWVMPKIEVNTFVRSAQWFHAA